VELYDYELVSGEVDPETTIVYQGKTSCKLVGATGQFRQRIELDIDLAGKPLTFTCQAYTVTAEDGVGSIGITVGGVLTQSAAVTADSAWHELSVSATPVEGRPIIISFYSGHATYPVYFDHAKLKLTDESSLSVLPVSDAFRSILHVQRSSPSVSGVAASVVPSTEWRLPVLVKNGYGYYNQFFSHDIPVEIVGEGMWPQIDSLADVVEINDDDARSIATSAALRVVRKAKAIDYLGLKEHWAMMEADIAKEEERMRRQIDRPNKVIQQLPRPNLRWG
jgi:hypothetical protein